MNQWYLVKVLGNGRHTHNCVRHCFSALADARQDWKMQDYDWKVIYSGHSVL